MTAKKNIDLMLFQEWEVKAAKAKEEYEKAMKEYKATLKGQSPKKSPKKAQAAVSPSKAGAGSGFKSKEFIDESSSSEDSDDKPLKKKAKVKAEVKKVSIEHWINDVFAINFYYYYFLSSLKNIQPLLVILHLHWKQKGLCSSNDMHLGE